MIGPGEMFGDTFLGLNQTKKSHVFNAVTMSDECVILRCTVNCFISRLVRYWELCEVVMKTIKCKLSHRRNLIASIRRQKALSIRVVIPTDDR